jgi:hypothetical protein
MGEAKRRGTFEQRKAEAMAAEAKQLEALAVRLRETRSTTKTAPRARGALGVGLVLAASLGMMR